MVVTVFGLGFVGLTTALGFAELGHTVYGVEANRERMDTIASGKLPFLEPGLDTALTRHLNHGFIPCEDLASAISASDAVYYCVGTPYGKDGQADLTYLYKALEQTLDVIRDDQVPACWSSNPLFLRQLRSARFCPSSQNTGKGGRDSGSGQQSRVSA